jgi:hypothetical protein
MTASIVRWVNLLAASAWVLALAFSIPVAAEAVETVEAAIVGGGANGQPAPEDVGGYFNQLDPPDINAWGDLAFSSSIYGVPSWRNSGIFVRWADGTVQTIVAEDDLVPGLEPARFDDLGGASTAINASGEVAFAARLDGGAPGSATAGVFLWSAEGGIAPLITNADAAPVVGGAIDRFGHLDLNEASQIAIRLGVTGGASQWAVYVLTPGAPAELAFAEGQPGPEGTQGNYWSTLGDPRLNDSGDVVVMLSIGSPSSSELSVVRSLSAVRASGGGHDLVALNGDAAPGTGGFLALGTSTHAFPEIGNLGEVFFGSDVVGPGGGKISTGLFWFLGDSLAPLLVAGDPIEGTDLTLTGFTSNWAVPSIHASGSGVLTAHAMIGHYPSMAHESNAVLRITDDGASLVAKRGEAAPDVGGTYQSFWENPVVNDASEVAFRAKVTSGSAGEAIFLPEPSGTLSLVLGLATLCGLRARRGSGGRRKGR